LRSDPSSSMIGTANRTGEIWMIFPFKIIPLTFANHRHQQPGHHSWGRFPGVKITQWSLWLFFIGWIDFAFNDFKSEVLW
jgi:hypothetical protein